MVDADGVPYPHTKSLYEALQLLSAADLAERGAARARSFLEQGITFSSSGREWVFPLDLIPRLVPEQEWEHIEAGVVQRVRALEAFLADVYGERQALADGVMPHSPVVTSKNFTREAAGIRPASGVRVHLAGIDLVRGGEPGGAHPGLPWVVPGAAGAAGRHLRCHDAGLAAGHGAARGERPDGRADDPGCAQLGVLRARLP